ncbi:MAG TPA: hypothetical protein DCE42_00385 [Myxococcales bacterium]|nr:hypothetical protein [Deltaproteobacteria bacterium]HAA53176.1 hypothetical protein [Myxococcales bacterium]|tara:strand:+ start:7706 stop:9520 length:1815 start_codon:yes stop_codon:yes gene_type:complete
MKEKLYASGGKVYECLIALVLTREQIPFWWGHRLPGTSVRSDFVILDQDGQPSHVLLVTHSTSESGTNMKYWRNVEELFELKLHAPEVKICQIAWARRWKPSLLHILSKIFDASLMIQDKDYHDRLDKALRTHLHSTTGSTLEDSMRTLDALWCTTRRPAWMLSFTQDLLALLHNATHNKQLAPLWQLEYERIQQKEPTFVRGVPLYLPKEATTPIRNTHFKSGLLRWSFLSEDERMALTQYLSDKILPNETIQSKMSSLGLVECRRTLRGVRLIPNKEVQYISTQLSLETREAILQRFANKHGTQLAPYLAPFSHTEQTIQLFEDTIWPALSKNIRTGANRLKRSITQAHQQPNTQLNIPIDTLLRLCKQLDKRFSYDVLIREAQIQPGSGPNRFGKIDLCRAQRGLPSERDLLAACRVFYRRLQALTKTTPQDSVPSFLSSAAKQIYTSLIKHPTINILHEAVLYFLEQRGWQILQHPIKLDSCLSDLSGVSKKTGHPTFSCLLQKAEQQMLLHLAYASQATHKHKEYPGKLRASRYTYHPDVENADAFSRCIEIPCVLLLDGCWADLFANQEKIQRVFYESGWDLVWDVQRALACDFQLPV